jgi:hypothetical protein
MKHNGKRLRVTYTRYANGQNAILLDYAVNGQSYAVASVSLEKPLLPDEVAIKNYCENEGILESLLDAGIVAPPHRFIQSGYVSFPICKLKKP